ncbi:ROK family transcriptional regulator [Lacihabitans sp. LS3-19]|uniref:ROK family transcriptional regulator n=1 Tax=Lacihabitans sp. LS3-19 TaxID=2487335 RepID=UPI0020CB921B|nr:ROK family transcriptional regulator [Lacihabitans sp. LS3-19]MCP9767691.1 ROK family transcriptional regulator [Lacihabitans sp. LS3-19]
MVNNNEQFSSVVEIKKNQYIVEILTEIYNSGAITIAQLAKKLHTSVPSITVYINELIANEWIAEVGSSKTKSGRRPSLFDLNPNKNQVLVIDINIYETNFYLLNLRNEILRRKTLTFDINSETLIEDLKFESSVFIGETKVWAIGISSPGLLSMERGINYSYPNHNENDRSLAEILQESLKIPTFITHDTQASMLGEHHFGLAKNKSNVLLINLDWGIGLGIMCNGQIIKGADGFAGELGHIQIKPDGMLCHCGKKGCLETVASALALINKAKQGIVEGKTSTLALKKDEIRLEDVVDAALKGDEFSIDLIFDIGRELGKGLSIAIHMFNPEIIIIDGVLTKAGELIVSTLNQAINKYCLTDFKKNLNVLISPMGDQAKIFGTKSLVYEKMLGLKLY